LAAAAAGRFSTDGDSTPPRVVRAYPAVRSGGSWVDTGLALAQLASGQAIVVEFSEPMAANSVRSAVRVEPSFAGLTDVPSPTTVVFVPDEAPEYGAPLTLVVSADAADSAGLKLGTDYREVFVPAVQPLSVLSITPGGGSPVRPPYATHTPSAGTEIDVAITPPDGLLTLTISFNASFNAASRAAARGRISLDAFFPGSLAAPELRSASWPSSYTMSLTWEGLKESAAGAPCLYLLSIDGGAGGLSNGGSGADGLVLGDDVELLLETEP
jgi:hypothetical protein